MVKISLSTCLYAVQWYIFLELYLCALIKGEVLYKDNTKDKYSFYCLIKKHYSNMLTFGLFTEAPL